MKFLIGFAIIALLFIATRLTIAHTGSAPPVIGISDDGSLHRCPESPNCVSSLDTDDVHQIDVLQLGESTTIADIAASLQTLPHVTVVTQQDNYLHATYKSRVLGFIDDLELQVTEKPGVFDVRSAARLGVSDLGVNRERVETLKTRLTTLQ